MFPDIMQQVIAKSVRSLYWDYFDFLSEIGISNQTILPSAKHLLWVFLMEYVTFVGVLHDSCFSHSLIPPPLFSHTHTC